MTFMTLSQSSAAEIDDLIVIESICVQMQHLIALFCVSPLPRIIAPSNVFKGEMSAHALI